MADPTTLVDYSTQAVAGAQAALTAAQGAAGTARAALDAARADLAAAGAAISAHAAEARRLRDALAAVATPADAAPLLTALDAETLAQREAEAAALTAELALTDGKRQAEQSAAASRLAQAVLGQAQQAQGTADADAVRRAAQAALLAAPPLDTLAADAAALLAAPTYDDAEAAVEDGMPARLLALARGRVATLLGRQANARTLRQALAQTLAEQAADAGTPTQRLAATQAAYDAACAALEAHAGSAATTFQRVEAALLRLAAPGRKGLSTEQRARLADAAALPARQDAADHAAALDAATLAREAAEFERDAEQARQAAGLPNTLPAKEAALAPLVTAEDDASDALPPAEQDLLRAWAAAAPDGIWRDLHALEDARRTLGRLAGVVAANLVNAVVTAEAALVAARLVADRAAAGLAATTALLAERSAAADAAEALTDRLAFAALRGDA